MKLQIRRARLSDAEALCQLDRQDLGYDYPLEQTRSKLEKILAQETDRVFVAELDGAVVGYVHANDYDALYAPPMKNIMGIAVSAACRKQGIGRALLAAVEAWARESGAAGVRLVSGAARTGAHDFYRRCGYGSEKQQLNFKKLFS